MSIAMGFPPTPAGGQGGGSFSPLTMFECTISSATMLIDSMAVRDLLMAFKIVAQLHGHLLEVLDPTVQRLATVADEHSQCPPPASRSTSGSGGLAGVAAAAAAAAAAGAPGTSKLGKPEPSFSGVKSEPGADSDDDCVLMEADLVYDGSGAGAAAFGQSPPAKLPRLGPGGGGGGGGGSDLSDSGELSNDWKATLRKAYRVLKDETGTNVFDFSLPYSARVNVLAANRVIDRALSLSQYQPANLSAWRSGCNRYMSVYFGCTLKPGVKKLHMASRWKRQFLFSLPSAKKLLEQAQLQQRMDRFKYLGSQFLCPLRNSIVFALPVVAEKYFKVYFSAVLKRDYKVQHQQRICDKVFHRVL
uniref:Exocyst subunit Exo70 family protein n=1 Tax=Macrostomum lignano TaxID=282301 RepID=A0A1I8GKB1_9PLAT